MLSLARQASVITLVAILALGSVATAQQLSLSVNDQADQVLIAPGERTSIDTIYAAAAPATVFLVASVATPMGGLDLGSLLLISSAPVVGRARLHLSFEMPRLPQIILAVQAVSLDEKGDLLISNHVQIKVTR